MARKAAKGRKETKGRGDKDRHERIPPWRREYVYTSAVAYSIQVFRPGEDFPPRALRARNGRGRESVCNCPRIAIGYSNRILAAGLSGSPQRNRTGKVGVAFASPPTPTLSLNAKGRRSFLSTLSSWRTDTTPIPRIRPIRFATPLAAPQKRPPPYPLASWEKAGAHGIPNRCVKVRQLAHCPVACAISRPRPSSRLQLASRVRCRKDFDRKCWRERPCLLLASCP
jgi:hypothetical protein